MKANLIQRDGAQIDNQNLVPSKLIWIKFPMGRDNAADLWSSDKTAKERKGKELYCLSVESFERWSTNWGTVD